jgi:hypothetical protein
MMRAALPAALLAAALALGTGLSGCSADPGITAQSSAGLQREVQAVAGLAAAHRYAAALTAATALRSDVRTALAAGRVSSERAVRIRAALALVETDLSTARSAATPSASRTPAPTHTPTATPAPVSTASSPRTTATAPKKTVPKKAPAPPIKQHGKRGKGHKGKGG